jgi:carboxyl-terminal processing protease
MFKNLSLASKGICLFKNQSMKSVSLKYKLLFVFFIVCAVFSAYTFIQHTDKQKMQMALVLSCLIQNHYDVPKIDDQYSKKVFVSFLKQLDHSKRFLTQEDSMAIAAYQTTLDDEVNDQHYVFFEKVNEIYERKLTLLATTFQTYLAEPFDFTVKESLQLDADKRPFAKNDAELKEQWRQYFKYLVMVDVQAKLDKQEKAIADKDTSFKVKTFELYEKEAREKILKDHTEMFKRLQKETKADRFADFVNAHVHVFDPHSDFFPPKEKENFDIAISGNLEGIGATLQEKDGYVKVMSIVPGSPSYKQGELKPDDLIMKVAQGDNEPVDIVDMRLDNAVKLIRGKKGTTVKLTVKKPSGIIKIISIVRDVVVMEESYAKSYVVVDEKTASRVGYINLPSFYVDFNNKNNRSCSKDIKIELSKLNAEGVDGIILDLRNNGGGSLSDVVTIGGYFIDYGPMVQVKGKEGLPEVLDDRMPGVDYNGPLVILVNQFSASASEILAAAMQDYKRAVIIGSPTTYGKGTVQRFFDLPTLEGEEPVGAAKVTTHKFYRIDGGSTQLKGVVPDIILPDVYANLGIGEKEMDYAMPWDKTVVSAYKVWNGKSLDLKKIKTNSQQRVDNSEAFKKIKQNAVYLKSKQDNTRYSLFLQDYKAMLVKNKKEEEVFNEEYKTIPDWDFTVLKADAAQLTDSTKAARSQEQLKNLKKDLYIYEGVQVIRDLVK